VFADALVPIAEVSSGVLIARRPPGTRPSTSNTPTSSIDIVSSSALARDAAFVCNGYRSAKLHGKPNLATARQAQ
jgi:hypothetical protein